MKKKTVRGIWKHPKTDNWIARYKSREGKWINRSTGTSDAAEAERISDGWRIQADRDRNFQTSQLSSGGITDAVARAERLARLGRLDAHAARDLINDLLCAAGQSPLDSVSNKSWCETWRKSKQGSVKERSQWKYEQVCRDWVRFLGGKADRATESVAKSDVVAYRTWLARCGLAPRTVNQTVKLLRGIYGQAVESGHLGRNPFVGVDRLRETLEDTQRIPFSSAEVSALIEMAEGDWKGLVILAATTGLRLMDAVRLTYQNLDRMNELIRVKTEKTGTVLTLPIHPRFSDWLKQRYSGSSEAALFPSLAKMSGAGKSGLSMSFKRLMKRAKIEPGVARPAAENSRGRSVSRKSFHSLRHFAATQFATNGVRAEIARAITGHADAETHANYVTADLDALRAAVQAIRLSTQ